VLLKLDISSSNSQGQSLSVEMPTPDLKHLLPRSTLNKGREMQQQPEVAKELDAGLVLHWCGDLRVQLCVTVDDEAVELRWRPQQSMELRVPLEEGKHTCSVTRENGDCEGKFDVEIESGIFHDIDAGLLYKRAVRDPENRSQFSFPDGRSACSFICCDSAMLFWDKLGAGADHEISRVDILPEDVAHALTGAMKKFQEEGGLDTLNAAGLQHTNVLEVLELCGWIWDGALLPAADGSFWGTLTDEDCLMQTLQQAVQHAETLHGIRKGPQFICIIRPPETLLVVVFAEVGLFGVFDSHTR